jgi:hypothetical protein
MRRRTNKEAFMLRTSTLAIAGVSILVLAAPAAAAGAPAYHVVKTVALGAPHRWDYVASAGASWRASELFLPEGGGRAKGPLLEQSRSNPAWPGRGRTNPCGSRGRTGKGAFPGDSGVLESRAPLV